MVKIIGGPRRDTRPRLVVGIDFGTTFTSVCIVHSSQPTIEHLVRGWPGGSRSGPRADVVPTLLFYEDATSRFGYEVEDAPNGEVDGLSWFKLLLQSQSQLQKEEGAEKEALKMEKEAPGKKEAFARMFIGVQKSQVEVAENVEVESIGEKTSISETTSSTKTSRISGMVGRFVKGAKKVSESMGYTPGNRLPATSMLWGPVYEPVPLPKRKPSAQKSPILQDDVRPHHDDNPSTPPPAEAPMPRLPVVYDTSTSHIASRILAHTLSTLKSLNLTPLQATTAFLRHLLTVINTEVRTTWPSFTHANTRFDFILTVPAIWSDAAKELMIQAATSAGFGQHRESFSLISEPEAAAVYTLKQNETALRVGEAVIICDAGGGTFDLIAYRIKSLNPLKVDEIVAGSGEMCGSVFLDEGFREYITAVMGEIWFNQLKPKTRKTMMRSWLEEKFKFGSETYEEDHEVGIAVPGAPDDEERNIDGGFHYMAVREMRKIFDPVVEKAVGLVKQQVVDVEKGGDKVKAVVLVGGFGSSPYLKSTLQTSFPTLKILTPGATSQTAVARGAVLRGLDGSVVLQRRARRYYGTAAFAIFQPSMGAEASQRKKYSKTQSHYEVPEKMFWYVKKGDILSSRDGGIGLEEGHVITMPFFRNFLVDAPNPATAHSRFKVRDVLYAWEPRYGTEEPPEFKWMQTERVVPVGVLETDLSKIPRNRLEKAVGKSGHQYYKIPYSLRMSLDGEVLKFELQFQGNIYSMCTVRFDENVLRNAGV